MYSLEDAFVGLVFAYSKQSTAVHAHKMLHMWEQKEGNRSRLRQAAFGSGWISTRVHLHCVARATAQAGYAGHSYICMSCSRTCSRMYRIAPLLAIARLCCLVNWGKVQKKEGVCPFVARLSHGKTITW